MIKVRCRAGGESSAPAQLWVGFKGVKLWLMAFDGMVNRACLVIVALVVVAIWGTAILTERFDPCESRKPT